MVTEQQIKLARDKFKEISGITIYTPDEGTLDDFEQSRYDGLVAALEAALSAQGQETNCAKCGMKKHTPLRVDRMGGYVCLTCIDTALSAQVQDVAGEHVAWRLRHKNDGPHMWEYYQLPEAEASDNVVIQKLTIKQLIDILNDDKHAGAQERPPEPHSPNASVPIGLLQKIWAEMYYGVGGEGGIDDSIAQWNLNEVVDILAMAGALPDVDEPTAPAKQEG